MGHRTHTLGFSTHVLYGTNVGFPICRQEIEADKALALQWFHAQRMFRQTSNKLLYAEALQKPPPISSPYTNTVNRTAGTKPSLCQNPKINQQAQADISAKITCKNVSNKVINKTNRTRAVQHETLALYNRFQPLQEPDNVHISTEDSDMSESNLELENSIQPLDDNISEWVTCSTVTPKNRSMVYHSAQKTPDFTPCTMETNSNLAGNKHGIGSFHKGITDQGHKFIQKAKLADIMPIGMEYSKASDYVHQSCHEAIQDLNSFNESAKSIPDHVLRDRHKHNDYRTCIQQNGESFGFVPLTPLQLYNGDSVKWDSTPDIIRGHHIIKDSGLPNFLGARIPIKSQLKPCRWRYYLNQYWDKQLPELIQFGFPLDFDRRQPHFSTDKNHTSALENQQHVAHYISEELSYGALYGPFKQIPFVAHMSPLMVRDKQNLDKKRTIIDLSWPKGFSVNDGVARNTYLQTYFTLRYPSVDLITQALCELGPDALI